MSVIDRLLSWQVVSGDAFGIKAWTTADHAYQEFFSDDNARGLLGAVATAGPQKRGNIKATRGNLADPASSPTRAEVPRGCVPLRIVRADEQTNSNRPPLINC